MSAYSDTQWITGQIAGWSPTRRKQPYDNGIKLMLSEGFYVSDGLMKNPDNDLYDRFTPDRKVFDKYKLLGKNILQIVNELCVLVDEKKDELPKRDWACLNYALKDLMIKNEDGYLLDYLLGAYGAEAINYQAWVRFSCDCVWSVCLRTFKYMPASALEEYARSVIPQRNFTEKCMKAVMSAIGDRKDIYGRESLPTDLVKELLFN